MNIDRYLKRQAELVEQHFETIIPGKGELYAAARYAILGDSKKLRPILMLATAETYGRNPDVAMTPACALEMIHTYSLIHDDLPCMDNDDMRRGKPSLHKHTNEAVAILTGDYFLTYAFELLSTAPKLKPAQKLKLIETFAQRSGGDGMIGGQILDIGLKGDLTQELLQQLHIKKTGALFSCAAECGAIIAEQDQNTINTLRAFGRDFGLAYQILDDIADAKKDEPISYLKVMSVGEAKKVASNLAASAHKHLKSIHLEDSPLVAFTDKILNQIA